MLKKSFSKKENLKEVETSLIEQFVYPKLGPGQLWETRWRWRSLKRGEKSSRKPGQRDSHQKGNRVTSVANRYTFGRTEGRTRRLVSFRPSVKRTSIQSSVIDVALTMKRIAEKLPYRDFADGGTIDEKTIHKNRTKRKLSPIASRHMDLSTGNAMCE